MSRKTKAELEQEIKQLKQLVKRFAQELNRSAQENEWLNKELLCKNDGIETLAGELERGSAELSMISRVHDTDLQKYVEMHNEFAPLRVEKHEQKERADNLNAEKSALWAEQKIHDEWNNIFESFVERPKPTDGAREAQKRLKKYIKNEYNRDVSTGTIGKHLKIPEWYKKKKPKT